MQDTTIAFQSTIHDRAAVTGSGPTPTGSVDFSFYSSNDCSGTGAAAGTGIALVAGVAHPSTSEGPLSAGSYSFQAHYSGDDNYTSGTDKCEKVTVGKGTPTVNTQIHSGTDGANPADVQDTTIAFQSTIHDRAVVTGSGPTPTGSVDFSFYSSNDCSGTGAAAGTGIALVAGVAHPSTSEGPLSAGSYSFQAHYSGDDNYTSGTDKCEKVTVGKGTPTVNTQIHSGTDGANPADVQDTTIAFQSTIHDRAVVTGSGPTPTGSVDFSFYSSNDCSGTGAAAGTGIALVAGVAHPSTSEGPLSAGSYSFQAHYSGDDNYTSGTDKCEKVTVGKAQPTIHTTLKNAANDSTISNGSSLPTFSSVYDTSALSGQVGSFSFNGTATVTYRFFKNSACSGTPFDTDVRTVASDGTVPKSKTEGPLQAGSYAFQAYYSGNGNYKDATSECEPFTIVLTALTPGYWKNHMANSNSKGPFYSTDCKNLSKYGGSCSTNGPWTIQYLPKSLGNFPVSSIITAFQVFQGMNCSTTKDQDAIGCLAGHLLAAKLNLANGSAPLACIVQAVVDADAFLQGQTVNGVPGVTYTGPSGKYTLTAAQRTFVISLKTVFDKYNNGISC